MNAKTTTPSEIVTGDRKETPTDTVIDATHEERLQTRRRHLEPKRNRETRARAKIGTGHGLESPHSLFAFELFQGRAD